MNNYLMFDRLLKCSVVPKVRKLPEVTSRHVTSRHVTSRHVTFIPGEDEPSDLPGQGEGEAAARQAGQVRNGEGCHVTPGMFYVTQNVTFSMFYVASHVTSCMFYVTSHVTST